MNVKRTERGWAGHFICADRCLFRRNTLLEFGTIKVVVSTIGNMVNIHASGYPNKFEIETIGAGRYFETMAFHAEEKKGFIDANVSRHVPFESSWAIAKPWKEGEANDMHEAVVDEISKGLLNGNKYEPD